MTRRRVISGVLALMGMAALAFGFATAPGGVAAAASVTTNNGCSNNVQPTPPSVIPMGLEGTMPATATKGKAFSVTSLKITAQVPAAFIQTGINLGLLKNGQSVAGALTAKIHATNATPADVNITGNGSGTVHAPGNPPVAEALTVVVSAGTKSWTPTAVGPVTLAQAKTGSLAASPSIVTDGSIQVNATIGTLVVKIICKPGTVSGNSVVPAATVAPFASVTAAEPVATTTSTTLLGQTTTSTTSTSVVSTTSTTSTTTTTKPSGPTSPAITLSSTVNLSAGDPVTVSGSGFSPYASLVIVECAPKFLTDSEPERHCDLDKAVATSSDVSGGFTASVRVLQTGAPSPYDFRAADPTSKCPPPQSSGAATCYLVVRNTEVTSETAVKAISFNVPGTPPATTTTSIQAQQVVQVPGSGGPAATPSNGGGTAGAPPASSSATAPVTQLASTGPLRHTAALAGVGLLLVDLGYLSLTASRPRRFRPTTANQRR